MKTLKDALPSSFTLYGNITKDESVRSVLRSNWLSVIVEGDSDVFDFSMWRYYIEM